MHQKHSFKGGMILFFVLFLCIARQSFADERVSLEEFLSEVKIENLSLKAKRSSAEADKEGAYGIRLPSPKANLIQMSMSGMNTLGFTVNQTLPFPTKILSEHSVRKAQAMASDADRMALEKEICAEGKYLYFSLWESQERLHFLKEKMRIVEHHITLAQAVSRSDSFLKIHVIKAENGLDLLKNDLLKAEQEARERQIQAAELLNRDPNTYRPVALEVSLSEIPIESSLQKPLRLETKKFEVEALRSKEREAKANWFPDFSLQYKQMGLTPVIPPYSEIMIGATFPFVFFWEANVESSRSAKKRHESELLYEREKRRVESERIISLERAASLKKQLDLFLNELLPRAEKRMKIVHNLAPRDMETLQEQQKSMEALPDLKLKALDVREQFEKTIMSLEKLKGKSG